MAFPSAHLSPWTVLAAQLMTVSCAESGVQALAAVCTGSAVTPTLTVAKVANQNLVNNLRRFQQLLPGPRR